MADQVRRVDYFYVEVPDKPGEGARVLSALKEAGINLLNFTAFPGSGGKGAARSRHRQRRRAGQGGEGCGADALRAQAGLLHPGAEPRRRRRARSSRSSPTRR